MKKINCCLNCVAPKRHLGCHDTCKEYKREKDEIAKEKEKIKKNKTDLISNYDYDVNSYNARNKNFRRRYK